MWFFYLALAYHCKDEKGGVSVESIVGPIYFVIPLLLAYHCKDEKGGVSVESIVGPIYVILLFSIGISL